MRSDPLRRWLLPVLVLALALAATAVAAPRAGRAGAVRVTAHGVGQVELGARFAALHAAGLVGRLTKGCELAGPNARAAALKAPLRGTVTFSMTTPRTVSDIVVTRGAAAHGVGIGARLSAIRAAFRRVRVDHSTEAMFGITLVKIPRGGGGEIQFAIDVHTHKVSLIGVPVIPFCE